MDDSRTTRLRDGLVDDLVRRGEIRAAAVETAFRAVPRHLFLSGEPIERVYRDEAIPTKHRHGQIISSSSQPAAMAVMLEQLDLHPGQRVLEIGAGTGYNAALLAHLVGPTGHVTTLDLDADIADAARAHLAVAGFDRVRVVQADGVCGYPAGAPYDRIVLTVGAWDIAPAWWRQLAPGGRLLLPLWLRGAQKTIAFEPRGGHLASVSVRSCGFMRLRGKFAGPEGYIPLAQLPGVSLGVEERAAIDPKTVATLLNGPGLALPTMVRATMGEIWTSLTLWLALRQPDFCTLSADAEAPDLPFLPTNDQGRYRFTCGLLGPATITLLALPSSSAAPDQPGPLTVHTHGSGANLTDRLVAEIMAWHTDGRPGDDRLRLRADPLPAIGSPAPDPGETVLVKRWTRLVVAWDDAGATANDR